jgi:hypothetical protein
MDNASKLLDTIIKAPLWFYFAATIACGAPLLDLGVLVRRGATSALTIFGLPLIFWWLCAFSLFVSSAFARALPYIRKRVELEIDRHKWRRIIAALPDDSRNILCVLEGLARNQFYFTPGAEALETLRDKAIVIAELVVDKSPAWGRYNLAHEYLRSYAHHREMFRAELQRTPEGASQIRQTMVAAEARARRSG